MVSCYATNRQLYTAKNSDTACIFCETDGMIDIIVIVTGPIFTKFLPYSIHLIVNYRSDLPFSNRLRDVAMTTNFRVKMSEIGRRFVAIAFR